MMFMYNLLHTPNLRTYFCEIKNGTHNFLIIHCDSTNVSFILKVFIFVFTNYLLIILLLFQRFTLKYTTSIHQVNLVLITRCVIAANYC